MLVIDYNNVNAINKNRCPYFFKVKENGNMISFQLEDNSWEEISMLINNERFGFNRDNRLNIYENGKMNISHLWYNGRNEEWEEELAVDLKGSLKKQIEQGVRFMLFNSPIARRSDNLYVNTYEDLIDFLKKGDF